MWRVMAAICLVMAAGALPFAAPAGQAAPEAKPAPQSMPAEQVAAGELGGLLGRPTRGPAGRDIGRIVDVLVDSQGQVRAVVVDVGGFLGVGSRKVAVAWNALRFSADAKTPMVTLMITPERLRSWADYIPGRPVAILGTTPAP